MDPAWAESGGNRYLLRLFRDYVYHQVGRSVAFGRVHMYYGLPGSPDHPIGLGTHTTNPQNNTKQMDEEGHPVLDLGHIVHSLNRVGVLCYAVCVWMVPDG